MQSSLLVWQIPGFHLELSKIHACVFAGMPGWSSCWWTVQTKQEGNWSLQELAPAKLQHQLWKLASLTLASSTPSQYWCPSGVHPSQFPILGGSMTSPSPSPSPWTSSRPPFHRYLSLGLHSPWTKAKALNKAFIIPTTARRKTTPNSQRKQTSPLFFLSIVAGNISRSLGSHFLKMAAFNPVIF